MTKIILTCILALLTIASPLNADTERFYETSVERINKHYRRNVRPYMNSAYHVAKWWSSWPSADFHERVSRNIGWGGKESEFRVDYIHYNIPGKPYPGLKGLKVKKFSVDYGWAGLNEGNVYHTYAVAYAVQNNKTISRGQLLRMGLHPSMMTEITKHLKIPKGLKLYRIDTSTAREARIQYDRQIRLRIPPKQIKISVPYEEPDQDAIDSILLYRTIEEFDRYLRGWPYQSWDSDAYTICQDILAE